MLARSVKRSTHRAREPLPHFLVERLLLDGGGYLESELLNGDAATATAKLHSARDALASAGMPVPAVEAMARYDWVARTLDGIVRRPDVHAADARATGSTPC